GTTDGWATVSGVAGGTVTPTSPSTPPPPPAAPVIIGEQALFARRLNKKKKLVGKPTLTGFRLDFSTAMNPDTAGDAGNYQVDWISTRRVKKKVVNILHPAPFNVHYDAATHSVSLLLGRKHAFAKGGQIMVIAAH